MSKTVVFTCNLCRAEHTHPNRLIGISHTSHNPPLARNLVTSNDNRAMSHVCKDCVQTILDLPEEHYMRKVNDKVGFGPKTPEGTNGS